MLDWNSDKIVVMSCLRNARCLLAKLNREGHVLSSPLIQFVRGIKPRWIPKSKSKIFYVRTPTPIDPEEAKPLETMYYHYKTKQRAVRNFLRVQLMEKETKAAIETAIEKDHTAELIAMEEQVNQWNSQVQIAREQAWLEDKTREEARNERYERRIQKDKDQRLQKAQTRLEKNLEEAQSFITLDNLDTEIERLLNVRQDYNFAIDKQGNKISADSIAKTQNADSPVDTKAKKGSFSG